VSVCESRYVYPYHLARGTCVDECRREPSLEIRQGDYDLLVCRECAVQIFTQRKRRVAGWGNGSFWRRPSENRWHHYRELI
jgi:hypothetical protein